MILKARKGTQWSFYSSIKTVKFDVDVVHVLYLDGTYDKVQFEGECYLLNDEGETIDRIRLDMPK